jgi:hypothetical protein
MSEPTTKTFRWQLAAVIFASSIPGSIAGVIYRGDSGYHGIDLNLFFMAVPVILFSLMLLLTGGLTRSKESAGPSKLFIAGALLFPVCFFVSYSIAKPVSSKLFPEEKALPFIDFLKTP